MTITVTKISDTKMDISINGIPDELDSELKNKIKMEIRDKIIWRMQDILNIKSGCNVKSITVEISDFNYTVPASVKL